MDGRLTETSVSRADLKGPNMSDSASVDPTDAAVPMYSTEHGGLARYLGELLVWHEVPNNSAEFCVGDLVPEMWRIYPSNAAAREEVEKVCGVLEAMSPRFPEET